MALFRDGSQQDINCSIDNESKLEKKKNLIVKTRNDNWHFYPILCYNIGMAFKITE